MPLPRTMSWKGLKLHHWHLILWEFPVRSDLEKILVALKVTMLMSAKVVFKTVLPILCCYGSCKSLQGGPNMLSESTPSSQFIDMWVAPFNRGLWIFKQHQLLHHAIVLESCLILDSAHVPCQSDSLLHICASFFKKKKKMVQKISTLYEFIASYVMNFPNCVCTHVLVIIPLWGHKLVYTVTSWGPLVK